MERFELIVVGAGPAGLSAAIEAAGYGLNVIVFDENRRPGGQLFKQIHKFFGSKEHKAKIRGYRIGEELLTSAEEKGVSVCLNAVVAGIYDGNEVTVQIGDKLSHIKGDAVLVATGAAENVVTFPGWTKPGVIGAGAAQTMMNLHFVKPGNRVLMLGTGNVGLVVGYQLLQAGCELVAMVDAAPRIGGYGVHASKLARVGVPFYLSHTIVSAEGEDRVSGVTIAEVDAKYQFIPGTEKHFDVDTVCLAVGLSPMSQLLKQAGCEMEDTRGGYIPQTDSYGQTSKPGLYVAGDVSGIEEASSAMIEGRIAGTAIAKQLGYIDEEEMKSRLLAHEEALEALRKGMFAPGSRGKAQTMTEEGIELSENLLHKGYIADGEITRFPGFSRRVGIHPVIECTQNIPCNPCQDACPRGCIVVGDEITSLPSLSADAACTGCGLCVAACSGQAIFLVDEETEPGYATVTIPYEFLPLPEPGDKGSALGRSGEPVCDAIVTSVKSSKLFDHTHLLSIRVPSEKAQDARFFIKEGSR